MRAAVIQFLAEYEPAFKAELALANKAYQAFEECHMHVADFAMSNEGMTPAQVQALYRLMQTCDDLNCDTAGELKFTKEQALSRLESALRLSHSPTPIR